MAGWLLLKEVENTWARRNRAATRRIFTLAKSFDPQKYQVEGSRQVYSDINWHNSTCKGPAATRS